MTPEDDKIVLYRHRPDGCVAEIPAIHSCHALILSREEAVADIRESRKGVTLAGLGIKDLINEGRKP